MRTLLSTITNHIPIPPAEPLPGSEFDRAWQLEREAWNTYQELDALMSRLYVLWNVAIRDRCWDSPAEQLWHRCHRISERASRRWRRRQSVVTALRNEQKEPQL